MEKKIWSNFTEIKNETRLCPLPLFIFNIRHKVLAEVTRQEKEIKGIKTGRGTQLSLFAGNMILYTWASKKIYQKARNDQPSILAVWQNIKSTYKKQWVFFTPATNTTEKKIVNTLPLIMILNKIKYLEINLIPAVKCLTNENDKLLLKEIDTRI